MLDGTLILPARPELARRPLPRVLVTVIAILATSLALLERPQTADASIPGVDWTVRTSAADNNWNSVTYGNGLFVAVAENGTAPGNRVMTSPDGSTWTLRSSAADNSWRSVTYGNGQFVAVSASGTNRVMTSPDGIKWTSRTTPALSGEQWRSVTYGNGQFVAVSASGTNRVMTSPDGISWNLRNNPSSTWTSVTYGNGLFVAVADGGANQVMTSPDGINWTSHTTPSPGRQWRSVTYGNGLFVAVAITGIGTGIRAMTSPDGITWTNQATPALNKDWISVTYGSGLFVAVAEAGTGNRVMTSPDGITWTLRNTPVDNEWRSVTYRNGMFVAVAGTGTGTRVMTSGTFPPEPPGFPPEPPRSPPELPRPEPVNGKSAVVAPVSGVIRVKVPGQGFESLTSLFEIPVGSLVDATRGRVRLEAETAGGPNDTQSAVFRDGVFRFLQPEGRTQVTLVLAGGNKRVCRRAAGKGGRAVRSLYSLGWTTSGARTSSARVVRSLWGKGRGRFKTKGKSGAATVRGTRWLTQDRCDGTLFRVTEGVVQVDDFARKPDVTLRPGDRYLARAK